VDEGHTQQLRVKGKLAKLKGKIWHDDRKPLSRWFQSQMRYSEIEAAYLEHGASAFAQGYGATTRSVEEGLGRAELNRMDKMRRWLIIVPLAMPIYLLLVRGLIFDGWNGWYYAFQRTVAEMMLSLRLLEHKLKS